MNESSLNFWLFTALCIIAYWAIRWVITYVREMRKLMADVWRNSEAMALEYRIDEAERLVTGDRPVDWYIENARDEINELTGGKA